ncbi:UNVERIFIED_CONTAM: hypothetical protein Slati_0875800 [Sesamum latifolium]|uniref:Uncharacterized protein n=1 Tax=Sesamum latifolium TaxID=2727402 RepID=A0AAW2XST7_9LAMI
MLVNDSWLTRWPNSSCLCTTPRTSYHSPLVLRGYESRTSGRLFRFDNYLAKSPGFIDLVRGVWEHPIYGTPMYSITRKLKALKPKFRMQRKEKGDLTANVNQAKVFLETIQKLLEADHSNELMLLIERVARLVLLKATKIEQNHGRDVIPHEEGEVRPVERDEVKNAIFDIAEDKAPGPDGYSSGFYKAAWSVIDDEVTAAIQDFFTSGHESDGGEFDSGKADSMDDSIVDRLKKHFNMAEFLLLAHRVIDDGDKASMDALQALKTRWESKIGPVHELLTRPSTLPRSTINDNPMVRSFRMARWNLARRVEEPPLPLMIEPTPMVEAPLGFAPPNPNPSSPTCGVPSPSTTGTSEAHLPLQWKLSYFGIAFYFHWERPTSAFKAGSSTGNEVCRCIQ